MNIMLHEKRFLATLIDAVIGFFLALLLSILLNIILEIEFMNFDYYYLIMFTITMFLYQFFCITILRDKTIGLYLMRLKIISNDWEYLTPKQNVLRSISISIPILFIANLVYMVTYHTKSTTLFDDISDTMVVYSNSRYHID